MLLQGQWVMHGGDPAVAGDTLEMFTFDFSNLSWSQAKLTGSPVQHRISYAATCHQGAMVVMAGEMLPVLLHATLARVSITIATRHDCLHPRPKTQVTGLSSHCCMNNTACACLRHMKQGTS